MCKIELSSYFFGDKSANEDFARSPNKLGCVAGVFTFDSSELWLLCIGMKFPPCVGNCVGGDKIFELLFEGWISEIDRFWNPNWLPELELIWLKCDLKILTACWNIAVGAAYVDCFFLPRILLPWFWLLAWNHLSFSVRQAFQVEECRHICVYHHLGHLVHIVFWDLKLDLCFLLHHFHRHRRCLCKNDKLKKL